MRAELLARFDTGVERRGTNCAKWDGLKGVFGRDDVIPMWVADMDFLSPREVTDALAARVAHGAFGYSSYNPDDALAVVEWMQKRHCAAVEPEWVSFSPGVVDSMFVAVRALTKPGDEVAVNTPVYGPFYMAIERAGCKKFECPLIEGEDGWRMDLNRLEEGFKRGIKLFMLCSPHNPIGRVWREEELDALDALCARYGVVVLADEIHGDLILPGHTQHSYAARRCKNITLISATKTFNVAALRHSSVIIADEELRKAFRDEFAKAGIDGINLFGALAQRAAYRQGEEWLDGLLEYLDGTRALVEEFMKAELPMIGVSRLEGTYLMWWDASALGMAHEDMYRFFVDEALMGVSDGKFFGDLGENHVRVNIAAPRKSVLTALDSLKAAARRRGL